MKSSFHGVDKDFRRGQQHLAAGDLHRDLHAAAAGHAFAGFGIADQVIDLQSILPLHQVSADDDALIETGAAHVAQLYIDDGPGITGIPHLHIVVAYTVKQGAARNLEVFDIVPMPDHIH